MRNPEDPRLDAVLRSAAAVRPGTADQERIFADAWSRVQASIGDGEHANRVQARRLDLIADREKAARRRRRTSRVASITLAVAVAGAGTAAAAEFISTPNR